ncbi:hypothetical protein WICPIJ_010124 [Wickerhamomyces pijperi]|uniref:Uncharacterized protein n=1 Tax=Wickerhamomyces pijperi TaxID=599730 RepID=A0A9P8TB94_WICPI|nr:hypothetical protein WICPIJ_010124 [Wickerhamomyces pijperi]
MIMLTKCYDSRSESDSKKFEILNEYTNRDSKENKGGLTMGQASDFITLSSLYGYTVLTGKMDQFIGKITKVDG